MKRLIVIQFLIVLVALAVSIYFFGADAYLPAAYGGATALINTLWLSRRVSSAGSLAEQDFTRSVYSIYFNAVQRFVFVLVALGVGLQALQLQAEPLLITFALAQIAYFFGERTPRLNK